jgi:hypothetical protein
VSLVEFVILPEKNKRKNQHFPEMFFFQDANYRKQIRGNETEAEADEDNPSLQGSH